MNITTNTGANRCIGRRLVNETLRRAAKKNFYVALVICAIGWPRVRHSLKPPRPLSAQTRRRLAQHPAGSTILTSTLVLGKLTTCSSHIRYPLSGSTTWIELNGTVTVLKIWDGTPIWRRSSPVTLRPTSKA
jgi:hypothetical protein